MWQYVMSPTDSAETLSWWKLIQSATKVYSSGVTIRQALAHSAHGRCVMRSAARPPPGLLYFSRSITVPHSVAFECEAESSAVVVEDATAQRWMHLQANELFCLFSPGVAREDGRQIGRISPPVQPPLSVVKWTGEGCASPSTLIPYPPGCTLKAWLGYPLTASTAFLHWPSPMHWALHA